MPKDGIYQITNLYTKQVLAFHSDADHGSELTFKSRIKSWTAFRLQWKGGRKYTLVADKNKMGIHISDTRRAPIAAKSPSLLHILSSSSALKQYRISNRAESKFISANLQVGGRYKVGLAKRRSGDKTQIWTFSYQRALPKSGGGKGGDKKNDKGKGKGGTKKNDKGKGKGGNKKNDKGQGKGNNKKNDKGKGKGTDGTMIVKPKPNMPPKPDPTTQQLIDSNNQLIQQIAQNTAWQQQLIAALVNRLLGVSGPGTGAGGGGSSFPSGDGGYITGDGSSPVTTPPISPPSTPEPGDDEDEPTTTPSSGAGTKIPTPRPKKKAGGGGKRKAGGRGRKKGKGKKKGSSKTDGSDPLG
ncbi:hypothetical protein K474DRAFT_1663034 [Panus rudis PR-1116 ss-1]|nr:hypothetical protein K474DRAFT_1663034 [Panus rudis PR-1116 ss-1]